MMALREKAEIVDAEGLRRIITRIAHEIVERNKGVDEIVLVGIRRRGVPIAQRIAARIKEFEGDEPAQGSLDITLYRDDLSLVANQPVVSGTEIPVDINGKVAVLIDDVLYTGRTVRAAMDALIDFGRPQGDPAGGRDRPRPSRAADPRGLRGQERADVEARSDRGQAGRGRRGRQRRDQGDGGVVSAVAPRSA